MVLILFLNHIHISTKGRIKNDQLFLDGENLEGWSIIFQF